MAIVVTTDVFCDRCNVWVFGCTGSKVKANAARARAKAEGWMGVNREGRTVDLCPECVKETASEQLGPGGPDESAEELF